MTKLFLNHYIIRLYLLLPITNQITLYLVHEELTVRHGLKQRECKSCHWQLDDILTL